MAVNTSHRKEPTEMNVITKAKDVFKHSRLMIKTDKHFPKKERFMMVKDIYELSKEIVTKPIAANDYMLNDEEQRSLRLRYQLEAVTACNATESKDSDISLEERYRLSRFPHLSYRNR